jgi:hypothetical protein
MGRSGNDHLRLGDTLDFAAPVAIGLASEENALGSSTRRRSRTVLGVVIHPKDHRDDFGLHLADTGEDVGAGRGGAEKGGVKGGGRCIAGKERRSSALVLLITAI